MKINVKEPNEEDMLSELMYHIEKIAVCMTMAAKSIEIVSANFGAIKNPQAREFIKQKVIALTERVNNDLKDIGINHTYTVQELFGPLGE